MSRQPISLSPDLKRLQDEGYDLELRSGFLLVKEVPYVNSKKEVQRGTLVMKLTLSANKTGKPDDHVSHFSGEHPCDNHGAVIAKIQNQTTERSLADGVVVQHTFSAKPKPSDSYDDYYDKVTTYANILGSYARLIDPGVTAKVFAPISSVDEDDSPFQYIDTASSRAEIVKATAKLGKHKLAIIGLGGTGAYILDFTAKTPADEIHLFDGDRLFQHNAFRAPGAPSLETLAENPYKVDYLKQIYSKMHRGITAHPVFLTEENVDLLRGFDFVFLSLDKGSAKQLIVSKLEAFGINFIDVGMGLYQGEDVIGGILRVTTSTPANRETARANIPFADGDANDLYANNIQVADLNAMNAALAVMRWKKHCGFYADFVKESNMNFTVELNQLQNEQKKGTE